MGTFGVDERQAALAQEATRTSLTDGLACLAASSRHWAIPDAVARRALSTWKDTWVVALAGKELPAPRAALSAALQAGDVGSTPLISGASARLSPMAAAVYNGTVAHALDYDDTILAARSHASSHLVAAIVSAASLSDIDGSTALRAYVVGLEAEGRLGEALGMRDRTIASWHPTGVLGTLGSAVTASVCLGLDEHATRAAIGIAASEASGVRANVGSMVKPLHSGIAARNGVQAALLAHAGMVPGVGALDDPTSGLAAALFGERYTVPAVGHFALDRSVILSDWGQAIKLYPSCARTQAAIAACLALRESCAAESVSSVTVRTGPGWRAVLRYPSPQTGAQAKFSMQWCVAWSLLRGRPDLRAFTDEAVRDEEEIRRLCTRVQLADDPRFALSDGAEVVVESDDGSVESQVVDFALGTPRNWPTSEALQMKVRDCCLAARLSCADRLDAELDKLGSAASVRRYLIDIADVIADASGR